MDTEPPENRGRSFAGDSTADIGHQVESREAFRAELASLVADAEDSGVDVDGDVDVDGAFECPTAADHPVDDVVVSLVAP